MRVAIEKAKEGIALGQTPFGACIARAGELLSSAHNVVWQTTDITAHAEIHAIREACRKLFTIDLSGCVIYSTCEPCPMCLGATLIAGVKRLVMGARLCDLSTNSVFSFGSYSVENFAAMTGWNLEIRGGVLGEECVTLYRNASVPLSR